MHKKDTLTPRLCCSRKTPGGRNKPTVNEENGFDVRTTIKQERVSSSVLPYDEIKKRLHRWYRTEYHIPRYNLTVSRQAFNHGILQNTVAHKGRSLFGVRMTMTNGNPDRQSRPLKETNYSRDAGRQKLQPNLAPVGVKSGRTCTVGSSVRYFPLKEKGFAWTQSTILLLRVCEGLENARDFWPVHFVQADDVYAEKLARKRRHLGNPVSSIFPGNRIVTARNMETGKTNR